MNLMHSWRYLAAVVVGVCMLAAPAMAAESEEDLAKQLSNPIANLISVPFQFNYDRGIGADRANGKTRTKETKHSDHLGG